MKRRLHRRIRNEERREIMLRRAAHLGASSAKPNDENLVGMAFSGGGIRSATFNLGVMQALADYKLLGRIDYLSTVSGGGYIGAWLSACVRRGNSLSEVESQIAPTRRGYEHGPEAKQIAHLRSYSNYLTPLLGIFSLDGWTLAAIYLRNVLINQSLILAPVIVLLCFLRWAVQGAIAAITHIPHHNGLPIWLIVARIVLSVLTVCWLLAAMYRLHQLDSINRDDGAAAFSNTKPRLLRWFAPLAALAAPIALGIWIVRPQGAEPTLFEPTAEFRGVGLLVFAGVGAFFFGIVRLIVAFGGVLARFWPAYKKLLQRLFGPAIVRSGVSSLIMIGEVALSAIAGALGGASLYLGLNLFLWQLRTPNTSVYSLLTLDWNFPPGAEAIALVTFGPPVYLLCLLFASFLEVWLRGSWIRKIGMSEGQREWWSRANAWLLFVAGLWVATCLVVFYLPVAFEYLVVAAQSYAPTIKFATVAGWIGTVAAGLLAGKSGSTGDGHSPWREFIARLGPPVFLIGLFAFSSIAVSSLVYRGGPLKNHKISRHFESLAAQAQEFDVAIRFYWVLGSGVAIALVLTLVDANIFSLNSLYANRLTRCYLGASYRNRFNEVVSPKSRPRLNAFTGFDPDDDVRFDDLRAPDIPRRELATWHSFLRSPPPAAPLTLRQSEQLKPTLLRLRKALVDCAQQGRVGALLAALDKWTTADWGSPSELSSELNEGIQHLLSQNVAPAAVKAVVKIELRSLIPQGPLQIINTALNISSSSRLEWQERKADSFVLSALYCGSASTGYKKMPPELREFTLGRAVAVSGSAVNPNMGYHTTPAVAALLTVFNVRLGWWMHNPLGAVKSQIDRVDASITKYFVQRNISRWNPEKGPAGHRLLFELAGLTNESSRFVQLSDGGHFENLGIYELVRRNCRYIIACDAGADPEYEFFDLASAVRKCREDLGVPIDIDVSSIRPSADGLSKWHVAVGEIRYDVISPNMLPGMLIYIKSSLTGDEPADVFNYKRQDKSFPHQTTLDQFFSESQFESYRALGYHAAREVFRDFSNFIG